MVNVVGLEVAAAVPPPPYMPVPGGPGLVTKIFTEPAATIAEAGTATVSSVPLTKVVFDVWATPFQFTTAFPPKLVPVTVRGNAAPPAVALSGFSCAMVGMVPAAGGVAGFEL